MLDDTDKKYNREGQTIFIIVKTHLEDVLACGGDYKCQNFTKPR